jgi:hypothetical protein
MRRLLAEPRYVLPFIVPLGAASLPLSFFIFTARLNIPVEQLPVERPAEEVAFVLSMGRGSIFTPQLAACSTPLYPPDRYLVGGDDLRVH